MAYQIIKQPNLGFSVWSTVVDDWVITNATPAEIAAWMIEDSAHRIHVQVEDIVRQLERGEKPYHQFTMTYEEAEQKAANIHGKRRGGGGHGNRE